MLLQPYVDTDDDEPTNPGTAAGRARVLVADDDDALRALIRMRLRRDGLEVVGARSGRTALDLFAGAADPGEEALDLIGMDHQMPGLTGLEVIRLLRLAVWSTPVIMITAFPDRLLVAEATALGVALVPKPLRLDALSDAAIAALLGHARPVSS